ncbi:MAG: glycosyltransferase [Verrucomicrobiae bacterium]|nr:glycosyltransferase [Verrucomicrobiae bacterium]
MNLETMALISIVLAAIPCGLFLVNLLVYRPLARSRRREEAITGHSACANPPPYVGGYGVSVLIPARNEEKNIRATLQSVLANRDVEFEVIVLNDHSTDRTVEMVREFAEQDSRVRLESAPPLPFGWCGKQHACHVLAQHAGHPLLVFMDADVRLAPDALARMALFMATHKHVALASGVPRQELGTFSERLLIPLIHFVLMGFLPMFMMRWTRRPGFSAGCGQLFVARADAYHQVGGHSTIRVTLHDGVKLPRAFRRAGFSTDLFDATDLATCRMYQTNAETWRGLGKNATEGLAAPGTILPMSVLLFGGQVLPFLLLVCAPWLSPGAMAWAAAAAGLAYLPRLIGVWRFQQNFGAALLHPLGVLALLAIQWHALFRSVLGRPAEWKGRRYSATGVAQPARSA